MEPFRVLVDRRVYAMQITDFDSQDKHALWNLLNDYVLIGDTKQTLLNAIKLYTHSVFEALSDGDTAKMKFYRHIK